jgi:flagellar basal-body rod protein FlgF
MDVSLYQAAAAMNATAKWQDLIAENLAASSISGARKQEISFENTEAGLASNMSGSAVTSYGIPTANVTINFQQGDLRATGNQMDFALEGPGFFTVQSPDGNKVYTRDGEFQLDSKGQLVTKQGYAVLGTGGPMQFNPNLPGPITISASGDVSQGDQVKGKLALVEFKDPQKLTPIGTATFESDTATPPAAATKTNVRQGFVEGANTSPTTEMASLITAMRLFESNQKVLQMQSDRMSKAITELGGTSTP